MKLTSFTREKTRTGNFNFLEFRKGKAYVLSLFVLSLVLFSSNTASAEGGFFEKMFKKAVKVMNANEGAALSSVSFFAPNDGVADITNVCACDDGLGNVTFEVTFDDWPDGTDPLLPGPFNVEIFYTSNPPPNEIGLTVLNVPADLAGGPITLSFGPVANAMVPGDVEIGSIIDVNTNNAYFINTADVPYTISQPLALTCPVDQTEMECQDQATIDAAFAAWLATFSYTGGCNEMVTDDNTGAPLACGGATTVTWTGVDGCGAMETCSATFTVTDAPAVMVTCPMNATEAACQDQATIDAAFAAWLATFSTSGGCNPMVSDDNTGAPLACGGTTTVTWTVTSDCEAPVMCSADFTVTAAPAVMVTCPMNATEAACQDQATIDAAFTAWLATFSTSGGCNPMVSDDNTGAPDACVGGTTTVTWTVTSDCEAPVMCSADFTVTAAPAVMVTCPANDVQPACQTQAAIDLAFMTWMGTFMTSGGCNPMVSNDNMGAPPACGGTTTVTWTVTSDCEAPVMCSADFTVTAAPAVMVTCPVNDVQPACQTQAAIDAAFAAWMGTFMTSGGCNPMVSDDNMGAPPACGGTTTVTWTVTSDCEAPVMCSADFTVTAAPPVMVTCPTDQTEMSCQTQAAVDAAFAAWMATFMTSGGCNPMVSDDNTGAPDACMGGTTTVTWTVTSDCEADVTCSADFTVTGSAMTLNCAMDQTEAADQTQAAVNAAFATWLATATATGGCGTTVTNNAGAAPDVCTGGTVTVTFTATSMAPCPDVQMCMADFTVPPTTLAVAPTAPQSSACSGTMMQVQGMPTGGSGMYTHSWSAAPNPLGPAGVTFDDPTLENPKATFTGSLVGIDYTFTLTYTATDAVTGCTETGTVDVFVPGTCDYEFKINDPCICLDDADVNADNGTFVEMVTIIGPGGAALPNGLVFAATNFAGAYSANPAMDNMVPGPNGAVLVPGQLLQYVDPVMFPVGQSVYNNGAIDLVAPAGSYFLLLTHVDHEGYSITAQGPNADTDGDPVTIEPGNTTLSIGNTCFYPDVDIIDMPATVCADDAPFTVQGTPVVTGIGTFNGDATFNGGVAPPYTYAVLPAGFLTDNGNGTATIDPAAAGPGCYVISYTFQDNPSIGTNEPGCYQAMEVELFVAPADDPTFATATNVYCPTAAINEVLNLNTMLSAWPACAPAPAPTDDARVNWYGGDGVNVIITDGADASGTLDIIASAAAGVYTICAEVGVGACQSNYCINIGVNPNLTPASAALVPDFSVCLVMNETFDLGGLLLPGSISGGTWAEVADANNLVDLLPGGGAQYLGGDGTVTLSYTVTDCDGDIESDQITLTIDQKPYGEFALPGNVCQDYVDGNPVAPLNPALDNTLPLNITNVPTGATTAFTSSPAGFIILVDDDLNPATADVPAFDPDAGPLSGECVDVLVTMTVTNDNACANSPYTVSQYVTVCASGNPAWTAPAGPVCQTAAPVNLALISNLNAQGVNNLIPSNVTWTGEGVSGNGVAPFGSFNGLAATFNPAAAGIGVHNICVTVGAPGCEATQCHDITVAPDYSVADVALTGDFNLCLSPDEVVDYYSLLTANANPAGQFSVTSITGSVFGQNLGSGFEYNGGCGTITVRYQFADDCNPNFDEVTISISQKPDVGAINDPGPLCVTDGPVNLFYSGTFSTCWGFLPGPPAPPVAGFPTLGVFAGPGVTDLGTGAFATFDPATAGEGVHQIIWSLIDPSGICTPVFVTTQIIVRAAGDPTFTIPNEVCLGDVQANGGIPLALDNPHPSLDQDDEVVWYGGLTGDVVDNGITGVFTPSQAGTYTICVETGDADCAQTYCEDIIVHENANATLAFTETTFNCIEPLNQAGNHTWDLRTMYIPGVTTEGGVWQVVASTSGAAVVLNEELIFQIGDCVQLTYTVTTAPGAVAPSACFAQSNLTLRFTEEPEPSFDLAEEVCWDGTANSITLPTVYNGTTHGTGGTIEYLWTATPALNAPVFSDPTVQQPTLDVVGAGTFQICLQERMDYPVCGGMPALDDVCAKTTCHTLTIHETNVEVIAAWTLPAPQCISGAVVDLDALVTGNIDGVFTGPGVELDPAHPNYRFNPAAIVIPAGQDWVEVSVCYTVGNGAGCDATECHTIRVYDDVDATLQDITQCMDANTQIDLTELFVTGVTDTYGSFVLNGQSANAPAATVTGDVLSFAQPALNIGDFWYDIQYTVGFNPPNGNCMASDIGRVNIENDAPTNTFCPPSQIVDNDPNICGALITYATPLFADECDGAGLEGYIVEGLPTGNVFPVGVTTVRWHYTDEDGNGPVECAFTITVNDTEVPHALCQDQITVVLAGLGSTIPAGNAFVTAAMVDAGSWDNCIGTEEYKVAWLSSLPDPTDPTDWKAQEGTTCDDVNSTRVIAMRVVDLAGNVDTCHANVAIKDYEAPDVECPGNIYVETDPGVCSAVVSYAATVSDNCMAVAEQTALFGGPVNGTQEVPASGSAGVGTVSGDIGIVNGNLNLAVNVSGLTGTITAAHIHAGAPGANGPVIFNLVAESTFPIGGTSVNWSAKIEGMHPTMVANNVLAEILAGNAYVNIHTTTNPGGEVRGQLTIQYNSNIPSGGTFPVGTTVVAFEGYETQTPYLLANTDKCQFLVTVVDAEMPVLSCDPTLRTNVNDAGLCSFTMPGIGYDVTATDNCGVDTLYHDYTVNANHAVSSTTLAGATFPVGITDVIWTAIDAQGNKASCTVQIEISDVENPTITNIPADMTVDCGSDIPAVVYPDINDNCLAIVDFSEVIVTDSSTDEQILLRTWNVIDPSGNTNSATQTITINDNIAPVASNVPADVTVDCGSDIPAVAAPTFVDNCSEFTVDFSEVIVTDSSTDEQVLLRTWVATDAAGNSTTVTQTITINDNIAPVASNVPADATVDCGSDIPAVAAPTFTDNCDEFTVDFSEVIVTDSSTDEQELLRTWVATDAAGNSTTVTQTITINDNIAPVASNVPADATVDCGSDIPAVAAPTFTDNCDEFTVDFSEVIVTDSSTDEQVLLRTWVATDAAGNSTTVTQTITINDNINPTITNVPQDITVQCASDIPAVVHPDIADNCDEVFVDFSETLVDEFSTDWQIIHRTWVATDAAGNQTTATQVITVLDTTDPVVVSQPADVTVDCGSDIPAIIPPVFTDNCNEFTVDFSEVTVADSSTDEQIIVRTWVATDDVGNSTTVTQTVTINDNAAPSVVSQPADMTVDCGSDIPAVVHAVFADNCDEFTVDFSEVIVTDSSTDEQVILRTWVATDEAGNSTTVTQTITINDDIAPVIANVPADVTVNCGDEIPAVVQPTITDNCDEVFVDFSETVTTITFGSGIVVTRTWVATDAAGNTSSAVQVVTVDDTVDPTIVCSTAPTSFGTDDGECSYKVTNTSLDPTADDNCDVYTVTHNYAMAPQSNSLNGAQFPVGQTQVGFTVTDAAGNTAECSITIDVVDDEDPTFVNCPTTMVMVGNDVDVCSGKLNWSIPVATDNCGIQLVAQTGGPAPGTAVPVGTAMTVTYTATDVNGNTSACTFDVQVIDTQKPEFDADIVMPGNITVQCDNIPAPFVLTNDDVYDNCTASADLVINFTEVSTQGTDPNDCGFYNYTITRTWTITDLAGNVRTHIQVITVVDTTAPTSVCTNQTVVLVLDLFGNVSLDPVTLIAGTTDNCAGFNNLTVTSSRTDFNCSDLGLQTITLTITDPCGNSATCDVTVDVQEGAAPCTPLYDINGSDPCVCLDNATDLVNGQFGEVLQIQSLAGQTWTVQSSTGLYSTASPAPPAAPTPLANGTVLSVVGNGTFYRLEARHVDAIGFSVTLVNNIGQVFTFSNVCYYPTPEFTNIPNEICLGTPAFTPEVEDLFAGSGAYLTPILFEVDGVAVTEINPASLGIGQHTVKAFVDAGTASPSRVVNGVAIDPPGGQLDPGCESMISYIFNIVTTPSQVTCNDLINLTIQPQPACESEINADQVLEGTYGCLDDYEVELYLANGTPLSPANVVTANQIGLTLIYQLVHPISGNVCWGQIKVEDKNAPTIVCPPNVSVLCTVDPDSVVHFMSTPVGVPNPLDYRARDYFGNLVPSGSCDSLLYFGHPSVDDCSSTLPWDCGGRTWTYNDDYTIYECAQNPSVIADIVRTFIVEDKWGNYSSCEQHLTWERGEADQVEWPVDYHIACNDPFLDDLIASNYDPYYTGWPAIYDLAAAPTLNKERLGTLLNRYLGQLNTTDNGICELGLTYEDQMVNICAKEWKIVRTWTLYDWCPEPGHPSITEFIQNIKVENVAPTINITCVGYTPQGYCILNATEPGNLPHYPCSAVYVPFADIDAGCDALVEVSVETELGNTTNGGVLPSPGLPIGGPYTITYRAEDQCGNITEYDLVVMVQDKTAPIAICDEITDVNLGILGQAVVDASTFDDGSYDGCALDHFLVRRMDSTCGSTSFAPTITFNCCDAANSPTMVVFRAVDHAGNTNDCMVEVVVNDKTPPILKSCPANERVSCDWYAANLETQLANAVDAEDQCNILSLYFGDAVYQDNCTPDVACTVSFDLDQCLDGTVRRTWIAEDASGNTNSSQNCNQTIFVDHVSDFVVEFPQHRNGEPTHLPAVECGTDVPDFGEPEIFYETCELVAVSYEDEVFTDVVDACYKIVRQWTVINWCVVGDQIDQEVVEESELAMRLSGCLSIINFECDLDGDGDCDDRTFRDSWRSCNLPDAAEANNQFNPDTDPDFDPWDGFITYQQVIKVNDTVDPVFTNGCTPADVCINDNTCAADITLPTPDIDECSSLVTFSVTSDLGTGFGPFFGVAPGVYNVRYVAMDNCNNQTACESTIRVLDCKKPTPYCKNGLIVELMVVDPAMVEVWASDLNANSFDNCPGDLIFSFSPNTNDLSQIFDCDDVEDPVNVEIWVTDAAGNQDFCTTFIDIQANMDQCDDSLAVHVGGAIQTELSEGVENVNVQLSGFGQMSVMTDAAGSFSFPVSLGGDYTVTPSKDDDHLNGVTTFDLVKATKHILGVELLNSPYKIIAADANKSGTVTTFDVVLIRKLILYINDEFPGNTSWRFIDKDYVFPNSLNPWQEFFPEVINFNNVAQDILGADYVAVKIGDLNGSATPNFASAGEDRSMTGSLVFNVKNERLEAGETYTVDFKATDFDVQGYQFTLNFDQNKVEFVEVAPAIAGAENFGFTLLNEGVITASWNDDNVKLAGDQVIFSLVFKANQNANLNNVIAVSSRYTVAEAYDTNGDLLDVELAFNGATVASAFELYQNTPNPFSKQTIIGFTLPEASTAKLTITDVSGKVVKVLENDYSKGYNEIKLQRNEFASKGILYYQLDTDTDSATKMMILID